jgi:HNH endonuclease
VTKTLGERLLDLHRVMPNGCWEWQGYRGANGYGQVRVNGTTRPSHRMMYMLFVDPNVGSDMVIDHKCRNRPCGNPDHLEAVSNMVNQERGLTKTAKSRTASLTGKCARGHDLSEWGRVRSNGYTRCVLCHREAEARRRGRMRQEAMT